MNTQIQVEFNDGLLMVEGINSGLGYGRIMNGLLADASTCIGSIHMLPISPGSDIYHVTDNYDQEILAFSERLLQSSLVRKVNLHFESPSNYEVDNIFGGLELVQIKAMLRTSWNNSRLAENFPGNGSSDVDSIDCLLESCHEFKLPNKSGVIILETAGRVVIFNPMINVGSLIIYGKAKDNPGYGEFIRKVGCQPSDMMLEATAIPST